MNTCGYIYVPNWERFQHYTKRNPPWIKLHQDLLGNDAWHELSPEDRCLLMTIWLLAGRYGNGRVRADLKWLCHHAVIGWSPRSRNLERLNHAGFIEIHASATLDQRQNTETDPPNPREAGASLRDKGTNPRAERERAEKYEKRNKAIAACRRLHNDMVTEGDPADAIRDVLEREYRHDLSIVDEAVPGWRAA